MKHRSISLATLALILFMPSSHGEWIMSGPMNIPLPPFAPGRQSIDIDSDGRVDLSFYFYYYITMDVPTSGGGGGIGISDTHGNYIWSYRGKVQPFLFKGLNPWPEPPESLWVCGHVGISSYSENLLDGTWTGWTGPWSGIDVGHIRVLYHDSTQSLHQAWIRLLIPDDRPFPTPIIMDWAYESEPFPEPTAGQPAKVDSGNRMEVTYSGLQKGLTYILEETRDLAAGNWTTSKVFNADSETFIDTNDMDSQCGFWRIRRTE